MKPPSSPEDFKDVVRRSEVEHVQGNLEVLLEFTKEDLEILLHFARAATSIRWIVILLTGIGAAVLTFYHLFSTIPFFKR